MCSFVGLKRKQNLSKYTYSFRYYVFIQVNDMKIQADTKFNCVQHPSIKIVFLEENTFKACMCYGIVLYYSLEWKCHEIDKLSRTIFPTRVTLCIPMWIRQQQKRFVSPVIEIVSVADLLLCPTVRIESCELDLRVRRKSVLKQALPHQIRRLYFPRRTCLRCFA
jgi:hypothetical protein